MKFIDMTESNTGKWCVRIKKRWEKNNYWIFQ